MTILTISKKNTLKLPSEVIQHLCKAKHVQVRLSPGGVSFVPVHIQPTIDRKAIPSINAPPAK